MLTLYCCRFLNNKGHLMDSDWLQIPQRKATITVTLIKALILVAMNGQDLLLTEVGDEREIRIQSAFLTVHMALIVIEDQGLQR